MTKPFAAVAVVNAARKSRPDSTGPELSITFRDKSGKSRTIDLTLEAARELETVLSDLSTGAPKLSFTSTKLPKEFSVGYGGQERLVLVSFDTDVPYALGSDDAYELGRALLEQSERVERRPLPLAH